MLRDTTEGGGSGFPEEMEAGVAVLLALSLVDMVSRMVIPAFYRIIALIFSSYFLLWGGGGP